MKCLQCGKKLAIFRKSSLGDFCCPEHREQYVAEQGDLGLARLLDFRPRGFAVDPEKSYGAVSHPAPEPVMALASVPASLALEPSRPDESRAPRGRSASRAATPGVTQMKPAGPLKTKVRAHPALERRQLGPEAAAMCGLTPRPTEPKRSGEARAVTTLTAEQLQRSPGIRGCSFLNEEIRASYRPARCHGYFQPLRLRQVLRSLDPAFPVALVALRPASETASQMTMLDCFATPADAEQHLFGIGGLASAPAWPVAPSHLRPAGLVLPWSTGAATGSFSLTPLVAAVWAREGSHHPRPASYEFDFTIEIVWPTFVASIACECPAEPRETVQVEPVQLQAEAVTPAAPEAIPAFEPAIRWADLPERAPEPDDTPEEPAWVFSGIEEIKKSEPVKPAPEPSRGWKLPKFLSPEAPVSAQALRRSRRYNRDEYYEIYEEPAAKRASDGGFSMAWIREIPVAPIVFGLFSVVFLGLSGFALLSVPSSSGPAVSLRLDSLRSALRARSSLRIEEDFRSGLTNWIGSPEWSKDWSYDRAGFLRPGKIGILKKSLPLQNYRMEFVGQIERKSIGWVFRASDIDNYYAAKITITKPGPLPTADLVHYVVSAGKAGPKMSVPLPFSIRNDTIYQVQMDIRGSQFSTKINGRQVDYWTDSNHRKGGVGFASEVGELARVRWLKVSDRDDFVGRICSFLSAEALRPDIDPVLSAFIYPLD